LPSRHFHSRPSGLAKLLGKFYREYLFKRKNPENPSVKAVCVLKCYGQSSK
jgi:hypothetical protein